MDCIFSLKAIVSGNMPAMADAIVQLILSLSLDSMLSRGVRDMYRPTMFYRQIATLLISHCVVMI
jgi:hypothetical protein